MTFRDARSKYDQYPFTKSETEPNPYYQEYLSKDDDTFLDGYDWAINEEMDSFFGNMDAYEDDLADILGIEPEEGENIPIDYELLSKEEPAEEDIKNASRETKLLLWAKQNLLNWMEMSRNELVTSMIDGMDEEEYRQNFKKIWGKYPD